jgi:ketopantoate hydroxymethyltransferase
MTEPRVRVPDLREMVEALVEDAHAIERAGVFAIVHLGEEVARAARAYADDVHAGRFPEVARPAATRQL